MAIEETILWLFLMIYGISLGSWFIYIFFKEHDKRRLILGLGILIGSINIVFFALGYIPQRSDFFIVSNVYSWTGICLILSIFFALNERFFLKDRNADYIFRIYSIFILGSSLLIFIPFFLREIIGPLRIILALEIIIVSIYLVVKNRELIGILFTLSIISFSISGISLSQNQTYFSIFSFFMAYTFLTLIIPIATFESGRKTEGIGSYFALKEKLEKTEANFKQVNREQKIIIDNVPAMIFFTNKQSKIIRTNEKFAEEFNKKSDELVGKQINDVFNEINQEYNIKDDQKIINTGIKKTNITKQIKTKDKDKWLLINKIPYKDNHGNIIGLIGFAFDFTEQRKAEEKIIQKNIELKKLNKLKTTFLNVTTHELRSPMTSIIGYLQMILKEKQGRLTSEQKKSLQICLNNSKRLNILIEDLLDFSRLESGTLKFVTEETNLYDMIDEIINTMNKPAEEKNIKLDSSIDEKLPILTIDSYRVKQVLINLVNNAIKFSSDGSPIHINAKKLKNDIQFEVQDFGRGIPEDKRNKIFETFYQVDTDKDRKVGGTGMGLSISRGIVMAHGGKIWVDSDESKGSIFKFTLPISSVDNIEDRFKQIDVFKTNK
jgi:PAS domain S-box-containing protein